MKKRKFAFAVALSLSAILLFGGCSSKSDSKSDTYYASSEEFNTVDNYDYYDYNGLSEYDYSPALEEAPAYSKSSSQSSYNSGSSESSTGIPEATSGRKLIKDVSYTIETLAFEESCNILDSSVASYGGYIQTSSLSNDLSYYSGIYSRSAQYVLRIPADRLDAFMNNIGNVGNVTGKSQSSRDVTLEYIDTESRAESLRLQREKLFELLERAENVEDMIILEERISDVTYELERNKSYLKNIDNLVSFSTVTINLHEVKRVTVAEPETVGQRMTSGIEESFYNIKTGFQEFAIGFVSDLPYLVIWGIILGIIAFVAIRILRKKLKKHKSEKAKTTGQAADTVEANTGDKQN